MKAPRPIYAAVISLSLLGLCATELTAGEYVLNYALDVDEVQVTGQARCQDAKICFVDLSGTKIRLSIKRDFSDVLGLRLSISGMGSCCFFRGGERDIRLDPQQLSHQIRVFRGIARQRN